MVSSAPDTTCALIGMSDSPEWDRRRRSGDDILARTVTVTWPRVALIKWSRSVERQ